MNAERMEVSFGAALTRRRVLRRVTRVWGEKFSKPLKVELFSNGTQRVTDMLIGSDMVDESSPLASLSFANLVADAVVLVEDIGHFT